MFFPRVMLFIVHTRHYAMRFKWALKLKLHICCFFSRFVRIYTLILITFIVFLLYLIQLLIQTTKRRNEKKKEEKRRNGHEWEFWCRCFCLNSIKFTHLQSIRFVSIRHQFFFDQMFVRSEIRCRCSRRCRYAAVCRFSLLSHKT